MYPLHQKEEHLVECDYRRSSLQVRRGGFVIGPLCDGGFHYILWCMRSATCRPALQVFINIRPLCFARNDLEQWEVVAAPSVAVTTAGDLRTSVCRVVIYLQRDMSGDSCQPQHHTLSHSTSSAPPLACPKTKTCSYRGAVGLGNKYVRINVGGTLFYTTLQVLTRLDSMLKAMFSGKKEVFTDKDGKLLIKIYYSCP